MWKYLPYRFLLACPLMMVVMMRGMGNGSGSGHRMGDKRSDHDSQDLPATRLDSSTRVGAGDGPTADTHDTAADGRPPVLEVPAAKNA